jgi:iron complex transport system ATP-binding protein
MSAATPAMSVRGLDVVLGGSHILHGVDLDVLPGEVLTLVGPNGAGKSTLLAAMAGDLDFSQGEIAIEGQPIGSMNTAAMARRRAVLVQRQTLAFGFRAHQVVEMGRAVWRRTERSDDDEQVVARSMEVADVTHLAERIVPTLSGGEQARVSFARLLAQETPIQFLDEPTAALDIKHQEAVLEQARVSADGGAAVVVVLHDLSLAAAWSDRICVLSHGRVRAVGSPREVLTSALLTEVYEHPVRVVDHQDSLLVVPVRGARAAVVPEGSPLTEESSCPVS